MNDRLRYRLGLRASNAARPYRNHAREAKTGQAPWEQEDFRDMCFGEELDEGEAMSEVTMQLTLPTGSPWNGKLTEGTRVAIERDGVIYTDVIATINRDPNTGVEALTLGGDPTDGAQ